jgi:hypothetical protein
MAEPDGALAAEVYVALLARLKRYREAIDATLQCLPPSRPVTGFAPSLTELCKLAGDFTAVLERSRSENDHIGFAAGQYAPETPQGQKLLAHELTHVVQQGGGKSNTVQTKLDVGPADQHQIHRSPGSIDRMSG